jgi:hypothetical protein
VEDRKVTPPRTSFDRTNNLDRMCIMHRCCITVWLYHEMQLL